MGLRRLQLLVYALAGCVIAVSAAALVSFDEPKGEGEEPVQLIVINTPASVQPPSTSSPDRLAEAQQPHPPVEISFRTDCAEIHGSDYTSDNEREWFLGNCVALARALPEATLPPSTQAPAPTPPPPPETPTPACSTASDDGPDCGEGTRSKTPRARRPAIEEPTDGTQEKSAPRVGQATVVVVRNTGIGDKDDD